MFNIILFFSKILHNLCIRLSIVALSSMAKGYELINFKYMSPQVWLWWF